MANGIARSVSNSIGFYLSNNVGDINSVENFKDRVIIRRKITILPCVSDDL